MYGKCKGATLSAQEVSAQVCLHLDNELIPVCLEKHFPPKVLIPCFVGSGGGQEVRATLFDQMYGGLQTWKCGIVSRLMVYWNT